MADRFLGTNQGLGDRTDLAMPASSWLEKYGLAESSLNVALRGLGKMEVYGSGQIRLLKENAFKSDDPDNQMGERTVGQGIPEADPAQYETVNVTLRDIGKRVKIDGLDSTALIAYERGGIAAVDEMGLNMSLCVALDALDNRLATVIASATDCWTPTEITAGALWSLETANIVDDMTDAVQSLGMYPDTVIIGFSDAQSVMASPEVTSRFGGMVGAGRAGPELLRTFFGSFGVRNVLIGRDAFYDGYVNLCVQGTGRPMETACGLILAYHPSEADQYGLHYSVTEPDERTRAYYTYITGDIVANPNMGVRIKTV